MDEKFWNLVKEASHFKESLPSISKDMTGGDILLLREEINEILKRYEQKGCYIIEATEPDISFIYPNGKSKIIYIGCSENLNERIHDHIRFLKKLKNFDHTQKLEEWWKSRYHYMNSFGAKITLITPVGGNKNIKNFERDIFEFFYNRYLSLPVGNAAFSYGE